MREALERRRLVGGGNGETISVTGKKQTNVNSDEMTPLTRQLNTLANEVKSLKEMQSNLANGIATSTAKITGEVHASRELTKQPENKDGGIELLRSIHGMLHQVTQSLKPIATNNETTLKNVIALRGLFYFFLMAYQTGSIKEGDKLDRTQWVYFIRAVSKRIGGLAVDEYKNLDADGQNQFVEDYAKKLFEWVRIVRQSDIQKPTK